MWTFSDPWGCQPRAVDPPKPLSCFSITELSHATHKVNVTEILKKGFGAHQLEINPQEYQTKFTWSGDRCKDPREIDPRNTLKFPGYYVWFAPEVALTKVQRATCCKMIKENGSQFADYIDNHSRYGSQALSLSLSDAVQLYEYSLRVFYERAIREPVSTLEIIFKKAGTKRYQYYVGYVLVICAKVNDWDPLPRFPNIDRSLDSNPIAILDTSELRFHPKGIAIQQIGQWCSWDQVEIAFHFPDIPGYLNTPHQCLPAEIRPFLLTSTTPLDYPKTVSQDIDSLQYCIAINGHTSYIALSQIYHIFCVPNKECPEKNENSEEEQMKHQIIRYQYQ